MNITVEQATAKYIELRDRKAQIAERHKTELAPLQEAMASIETWLLDKMNQEGVDSFKTPAGTPYRSVAISMKLEDDAAFKNFVFAPAVQAVVNYLSATGHAVLPVDQEAVAQIVRDHANWGVVDFRAGKKGIQEYQEESGVLPPGVSTSQFSTVNVRRS